MDNDDVKNVINRLKCLGEYIQGAYDSHRDEGSRSVLSSIGSKVEDIRFDLIDFVDYCSEIKESND